MTLKPIKNALISVSDKTEIVEFAKSLIALNTTIYSSGGTYKTLVNAGIVAKEVAEYTQFPEIMGGRIKTLHTKIHGGILARRGVDEDDMRRHDIMAIDLVVVNLYPFVETIKDPDTTLEQAIENIDIGGPTMIRSAAKNHCDVCVIVDNSDYNTLITALQNGGTDLATRQLLAQKAFAHTACYDAAIQQYLARHTEQIFTEQLPLAFTKKQELRYGENPHQTASFYTTDNQKLFCVGNCRQIQGKELSYNNIADADAAIHCLSQFSDPSCVIVKHANPCGVATDSGKTSITDIYQRAFNADKESAFGGIIAINCALTGQLAQQILNNQFTEVIIAPTASEEAQEILQSKPKIRLLLCDRPMQHPTKQLNYKSVRGGLLVQSSDDKLISLADCEVVTTTQPTATQLSDLSFAWKVAKCVKSNAIVYAKDLGIIGIGAGQMSRVNSARIAVHKAEQAGFSIAGSAMASDAFFPFRDSVDEAAKNGISCIVQPGGSIRDSEVINAANEHNIAMVLTKTRHFYH